MIETSKVIIIIVCCLAVACVFGILGVGGYIGYKLHQVSSVVKSFSETISIEELKTGDILLFTADITHSVSALIGGGLTMLRTNSPWTHVSVVVRHPETKQPYSIEYTLESTKPRSAGVGFGIMPVAARLANYNGSIFVRSLVLEKDIDAEGWAETLELLATTGSTKYNFMIPFAIWDRVGLPCVPAIAMSTKTKDDEDRLLCTDIVAKLLYKLGIFIAYERHLLPVDFGSDTKQKLTTAYSRERRLFLPECFSGFAGTSPMS